MHRILRAAATAVAATSAALLIGAGTANAATPADTQVLAGDSSLSSGLGNILEDVSDTVFDLLGLLGINL
ncbi:MAG TPA: hypothetical protein VH008_21705 [Pseudonocardia sp.]|jgi:hypothetical protein|nr:hypothetical protein [Pseudonocardia sp.]